MKILIVDDSKVIRLSLGTYLKKMGHVITEAEDGQAALVLLRKTPRAFDLVITDLNMPFKTGLQLIDDMMEDGDLRGIPTVLYSTDSSRWLVQEMERKGRFCADKNKGVTDIEEVLKKIE